MDTILLWGTLAIFCALLESIGLWRYGLTVGFFITTTLLAIHYDFGSDYWAYYDWYHESTSMPIPNSISEFVEMSRDPGWDILNILFGRLFGAYGFFIMVAILSVIEGFCYYTFIKKHVPSKWYWLGMALYVLNNHFFILTFSMMRQSLVMALLLPCFTLIQQKKIITPLIIVLILSTIHNSVLLCIPLLAIPLLPVNNQKLIGITLVILWLFFLLASQYLEPILKQVASITSAFDRYVYVYTKESNMTFGLGYILRILPFGYMIFGLLSSRFDDTYIPFMLIWSLAIILIPFGTIVPLFARLLFYFELAELAIIPILYSNIQYKTVKYVMVHASIAYSAYSLYTSFYLSTSVYYESFLIFRTIFEVI